MKVLMHALAASSEELRARTGKPPLVENRNLVWQLHFVEFENLTMSRRPRKYQRCDLQLAQKFHQVYLHCLNYEHLNDQIICS
jgi:hypothetical protein